jgi:hypothetical protein
MRIVELTIDLLDELTGFDAVALVNQPAIESGWHSFNDIDVEDAIAFQVIKNAFEEVSQEFSLFEDLPTVTQDKLIERLRALGISMESLEGLGLVVISEEEYNKQSFGLPTKSSANPEESTSDVNGRYKILYQYSGPKDGKNRDFCRRVLDLGMLFRKEDVSKLTITGANSEEFGYYDIFEYKGSFGCRHRWNKVYVYQKQGGLSALETAALLMDENRKRVESTTFSKQKEYKFATDQDHQIVVGPLMIPDKLIFRVDENNEPYYTYFSRDTIVDLANKMMKNKLLDRINLEHDPDSPVEGYMLENWIVTDEEHDKSKAYGLDVPVGTWMGMFKIDNPAVWEMVKAGKVTGFSIEGFFADRLVQN